MPTRSYSYQASRGNSDLVTLKDLSEAKNVFDEDFSADMEMKDWNGWMQAEGNIMQLDAPIIERRESVASTASWLENTSANLGRTSKDTMFPTFLNNNEFSFEDALLEFDEITPPLYNGLPNSNLSSSSNDTIQTPTTTEAPRTFRAFSSLTEEEERNLTDIAMPCNVLSADAQIKDSPEASTPEHSYSPSVHSPSPEPPTRTRKNKKRKSAIDETALCQSRKTGHNAIEKRYRTNLNEKIDCLRQSVPAFARRSSNNTESNDGEEEDEDMDAGEDSKIGRQKYGKAAILTRALEYIKHLENTTERLGSEVDLLKNRVGAFEKLAMSGSIVLSDRLGLVASGVVVVKHETLESIRADFKQVNLKYRPLPGSNTRRRNSRQAAKVESEL